MRGSRPMTEASEFPAVTAPRMSTVRDLDAAVATCRACPRLVAWREEAGRVKRRAFRDWDYWARPVPGFGPPDAPLVIIGLAPAAHGGNRTGRIFTGDPSGDALYAALYDIGLASQPAATHRGDGMQLYGVRITVPVHLPRTGPPPPSATHAARGSPTSWNCWARLCGRSWCSARSPGRRSCLCWPAPDGGCPDRAPASGMAPKRWSSIRGASGRCA